MAVTLHREGIKVNLLAPSGPLCRMRSFSREDVGLIEIRATEEIMAAWAAQLTFLVVKFVAAARAPAPRFALDLTRIGALNRCGIRHRETLLIQVGCHSTTLRPSGGNLQVKGTSTTT
jgi:hypothetical protein